MWADYPIFSQANADNPIENKRPFEFRMFGGAICSQHITDYISQYMKNWLEIGSIFLKCSYSKLCGVSDLHIPLFISNISIWKNYKYEPIESNGVISLPNPSYKLDYNHILRKKNKHKSEVVSERYYDSIYYVIFLILENGVFLRNNEHITKISEPNSMDISPSYRSNGRYDHPSRIEWNKNLKIVILKGIVYNRKMSILIPLDISNIDLLLQIFPNLSEVILAPGIGIPKDNKYSRIMFHLDSKY